MSASPAAGVTAIALALLAAVFVSSPLHSPLNNPNEGVRVFTVRALVEHHTFAIDDVVADWGFIDDKARCESNHRCSSKAPLVSLIAAGAYALVHPFSGDLSRDALTRFCRVTGGVIPAGIALAILWWALRRRAKDAVVVDVAVVSLVVGTGVLASLNVFSGHALAAIAPAAVLALVLLDEVPSRRRLITAAALLSLATCAEYPAVLALPLLLPLILRAEQRAKAVVVVVGAGFVAALPTMIAHTLMFGAPWRTGYSSLDNPDYQPLVEGTFFGIGLPQPAVLFSVLFSPELGLFFFSPLLLCGIAGIALLPKQVRAVVVAVVCAFLLFIAGFRGWRGGWSVGPRYISELAGVLTVTAVVALQRLPSTTARWLAFGGAAIGVVHSGVAGALFPHLPDVLRNPVVELALPLVVRGVCPDSVPLLLGLSPAVAVVVVVGVVALPLLVVALVHRERAVIAVLVVPLVILVDAALPSTKPAIAGREVRRALDNWRPERGVPYLEGGPADPRVLLAIDRGRALRGKTISCAFAGPLPRRPDVGGGGLRAALAGIPDGALVIVDDALGPHIGPAGGSALVVTFTDLDRHLTRFPCAGDVFVVQRPGAPLKLRGLTATGAVDVEEGWVVTRLAR
ncbi:MAG: hypothetical protein Q8O67_30570 [Deltaproteobacteria bacterium]|nr:hypothetical protein [Deltaproteobacteria bacterium]